MIFQSLEFPLIQLYYQVCINTFRIFCRLNVNVLYVCLSSTAEAHRPWTLAEQRALEKALRAHPARPDEPSSIRWQHIADEVGTRTRRECLQRFKDLAEQVLLELVCLLSCGTDLIPG